MIIFDWICSFTKSIGDDLIELRQIEVIQHFEGKCFRFYGIHIAHIFHKYVVLLYLYYKYYINHRSGNWILFDLLILWQKTFKNKDLWRWLDHVFVLDFKIEYVIILSIIYRF